MKRVYSTEEALKAFPDPVHPHKWTAVIPAAGKGSRLGYSLPKVLYPILEKPLIQWVVEILIPFCDQFIFILSPEGKTHLQPVLERLIPVEQFRVVVQPFPTGMGDAILLSRGEVKTPHALIVWGDQVTLREETVRLSMQAHESREGAFLTLPTVFKKNPYISFLRDPEDRLVRVLQAREGEITTDLGENDCGLFLFSRAALFDELSRAKSRETAMGYRTGEFNLLPVLPAFENGLGSVASLRIALEEETLGVNTPEEAKVVETLLKRRIRGIQP